MLRIALSLAFLALIPSALAGVALIDIEFNDSVDRETALEQGLADCDILELDDHRALAFTLPEQRALLEGLGLKVESFLDMQGIDAAQAAATVQQPQARTVVRLYADKPITTEWLIGWLVDMGIPDPIIERPGGTGEADIVVVIGADFPADKLD